MNSELPLPEALTELGMRGLAERVDDLLAMATKSRMGPLQFLEELIRIERADRARRSLERRHSRARVGSFKPIADFDWDWPTKIDQEAVKRALRGDYVREGANMILIGAHGLGKTMLLKNLAHQAILAGHTVLFSTAARLLGELSGLDSPSKLERRIKHYSSVRLLCIDELGYLSYDDRAADLLFEIVNRRYEAKRSIALSTNLAFRDWSTVFPHATCTVALVDRLTHRSDVIKIEGKSWRRKEAQERARRNS